MLPVADSGQADTEAKEDRRVSDVVDVMLPVMWLM